MRCPSSETHEFHCLAEREAAALRARIAALGERGRTTPYPMEIRQSILEYAEKWRAHGFSWKRIGRNVGLSGWAVERWWRLSVEGKATERQSVALLPVQVKPEEATPMAPSERRALAVVSPGGYRVEGLVLSEVAQLLRALP